MRKKQRKMGFVEIVSPITGARYCEAYLVPEKMDLVWFVIPMGKEEEFHRIVGTKGRRRVCMPMEDWTAAAMKNYSKSGRCRYTYEMHFHHGYAARVRMLQRIGFLKGKKDGMGAIGKRGII